ncbi:gamma-aminobutyric acid receptor subunit alpha-3 [Eurytemora carolleeae]|uniref:gamma-aminobutyric acid receptor subunit alpha-3 n=1 Tax=Eurytemora carolleeae TaxID=1294199 RepID=UPI000C78130A|nr:gamma-aminobutyric acid receptor subunit alpha-3 [Eurytemora carolleeae]|eukprot:XP_023344944.1 gamma-aminobutyric acid receptor subunit alpha-3-like [Eurytemora affinis]
MDLRKFPLDSQRCPLEIGSFGFDTTEMTYSWSAKPMSMDDDLELAQYKLVNFTYGSRDAIIQTGQRSVIYLVFFFERAVGFYILQVYVPLTIIVMSSWVTFWLVKTEKGQETPARTQLGATTVLAVVTIGFGGKAKPQVGYATALDVFIIICFISVFTALIEFAFINFLDLFIRRLKHRDLTRVLTLNDMTRSMTAPLVHIQHLENKVKPSSVLPKTGDEGDLTRKFSVPGVKTAVRSLSEIETSSGNADDIPNILQVLEVIEPPSDSRTNGTLSWMDRLWGILFDRLIGINWLGKIRKTQLYHDTPRIINRMDAVCRKVFPMLFTLLNIFYWTTYLYVW